MLRDKGKKIHVLFQHRSVSLGKLGQIYTVAKG